MSDIHFGKPRADERISGDPLLAEAARVSCCRVVAQVDDADGITRVDAKSVVLPDGRVATLVVHPNTEAATLAAARIARGDRDLYADDGRPVAHAVADALIAAGLGRR